MIRKFLPYFVFKRLWGDRRRYGTKIQDDDPEYQNWREKEFELYHENEGNLIYKWVKRKSMLPIESISLDGKVVLETGPGAMHHCEYLNGVPKKYLILDFRQVSLEMASAVLEKNNIKHEKILVSQHNEKLPLPDDSVDIVFSFNVLEHLYNLDKYLVEYKRVLKPGGVLVGTVPCEGGLFWGLARFLTSRRFAMKKLEANYDKIICWEHPNFADRIVSGLAVWFKDGETRRFPFAFLGLDFNFILFFRYFKEQGN